PAVLIALSLILVGIIVLKVVPAFSDFYGTFGAELPLVTKIIVRVSAVIREDWLLIIVALAAGSVAFTVWLKQPGQKSRFDRAIVGLPLLGEVARKFATSQMSRTLATLLGGGLPLVNALDIAAQSVGNQFFADQLRAVAGRVREGASFATGLQERG